jgi:hypothetical protein
MLFWVLVCVVVACVLQFRGPYAGWLNKTLALGTEPPPVEKPKTPEPVEQKTPDPEPTEVETTDSPEPEPVEIPKTETEILYDQLYAKYLKRMPPAVEEGANYVLMTREREKVRGRLLSRSPGKIVMELEFGKLTYTVQRIHKDAYPELFPERVAKTLALKELKKILSDRARKKREEEIAARQVATAPKVVAKVTPKQPDDKPEVSEVREPVKPEVFVTNTPPRKVGPLKYDVSGAPTPEEMKKTVAGFGMWLNAQQRRMGGSIVTKIHAKRHGGNAILYMHMHRNFLVQDYDVRYGLSESFWRFWWTRCESAGIVGDPSRAHVVFVDNGKVVGGSTTTDGSNLWVKD